MQRQNYFKASSLARLADYVDIAAMVLDDSMRCGEPEARAALALGRIERLEYSRDDFRRHAGAGVGDPKARRLPFDSRARFDRSALWHRVDRIEDQVEGNFA